MIELIDGYQEMLGAYMQMDPTGALMKPPPPPPPGQNRPQAPPAPTRGMNGKGPPGMPQTQAPPPGIGGPPLPGP